MVATMLDRANRVRRRSEYAVVIRAGRRAGRRTLVVHRYHGADAGPARAGFVVSRAVGGAVVRNRVRRRLRHLIRGHLAELPPGTLLVVRALPAAAGASADQLRADLAAGVSATSGRSATSGASSSSGGSGTGPAGGSVPGGVAGSGAGAPAP